jgi:hypothetical protein
VLEDVGHRELGARRRACQVGVTDVADDGAEHRSDLFELLHSVDGPSERYGDRLAISADGDQVTDVFRCHGCSVR